MEFNLCLSLFVIVLYFLIFSIILEMWYCSELEKSAGCLG